MLNMQFVSNSLVVIWLFRFIFSHRKVGFVTCELVRKSCTSFSKVGSQETAKWQFWRTTQCPEAAASLTFVSAMGPWPCPKDIVTNVWSATISYYYFVDMNFDVFQIADFSHQRTFEEKPWGLSRDWGQRWEEWSCCCPRNSFPGQRSEGQHTPCPTCELRSSELLT